MAVLYTYSQEQDKHYITNNEGTDLSYSLSKKSDCVDFTETDSGIISPSEKLQMNVSLDGEYKVELTNQAVETATVEISHYLQLEESLVEGIFTILCGCECGCNPCSQIDTSGYEAILITLSKAQALIRLLDPLYSTYLSTVYEETNCLITPDIYCNITTELTTGSSVYNEELLKKLLALDYLAVYFYELDLVSTDEDIAYVKNKYKTENILCCIRKLGIDVTAIKVKIDAI